MIIKLEKNELNMLNKIIVLMNLGKEYEEDEVDNIVDEIYFNESTKVRYYNDITEKCARITDKINSLGRIML